MRPWVLVVLAMAGCIRFGLDPLPENPDADDDAAVDGDADEDADQDPDGDAEADVPPPPHDEDGDGIGDPTDRCPHVADPDQADSDRDGVGDACDPNPASAHDRIAFFDPFTEPNAAWALAGPTPSFVDDSLVVDATAEAFVASLPTEAGRDELYGLAGRIVSTGSGQQHLMLGLGEEPFFPPEGTPSAYYYCEVCSGGVCGYTPFFSFTTTEDNAIFRHVDQATAAPFEARAFELAFRQASATVECTTTLPADATTLSGPVPEGITPVRGGVRIRGLEVALDYFVHIVSEE